MSDLQLVHWWRDLWADLRDVNVRLDAAAGRFGLDVSVVDLLWSLRLAPDHRLCMKQLCHQLRCSTSGMTKMVDRAEDSGLVERVRPSTDRRLVEVELTAAGRELLTHLIAVHAEHLRGSLPSTARVRASVALTPVRTEGSPRARPAG